MGAEDVHLDDLLDLRYESGQWPLGGACDCMTLAWEVRHRAGHAFPMPKAYSDGRVEPDEYEKWRSRYIELVRPSAWCIVGMHGENQGGHVGVVLPCRRKFIHATRVRGIEISRLALWTRFMIGFYELK